MLITDCAVLLHIYVEIQAVELAAYRPDKLIHNICSFGLSHVELTAALVVVWS